MTVRRQAFQSEEDGLWRTRIIDDEIPEGDPDRIIYTSAQGFPTKIAAREDGRRADLMVTGAAAKCQAQLAEAQKDNATLTADLEDANQRADHLAADLTLCQESLEASEEKAGALQTALDGATDTINARDVTIDQMQTTIDDKDALIRVKDIQIQGMEQEIANLEAELAACQEPPPPPPPVATKPVLGSGPAILSDDTAYQPPAGATAPATHAYGGIDRGQLQWGTPIGPDTAAFNLRPRKKPSGTGQIAVHVYQGSGGACTVPNCGQVPNHQNHDDAVTKVLSGQYNTLIDQAADQVKAIPRRLIGDVWHEFLEKGELFPGQTLADVAAVIEFIIGRFNARGVTNVDWYSCPFGSQYASGVAQQLHTPALKALLTGYGADIYFTPPDIATGVADLTKNSAWKAFAEYEPDAPHVIFETGLWNGTGLQQKAYFEALAKWYAEHPSWAALFGFFRFDQAAGHDGRLILPEGKAAWDVIVDGDAFVRALA